VVRGKGATIKGLKKRKTHEGNGEILRLIGRHHRRPSSPEMIRGYETPPKKSCAFGGRKKKTPMGCNWTRDKKNEGLLERRLNEKKVEKKSGDEKRPRKKDRLD